jgi:signal transduction histidine kinase/DNA-binding response OmpR family regulator
MLAGGAGLIVMLALDPTGENYYDGPLLIILTTFVLVRLRFVFASSVALLLLAAYTAVAAGLKVAPFHDPVGNVVMMAATVLIGMFAGYLLEDYARREFWQTRVLNEKRKENARLLQSRSRFFANVSHEFRTPLTLILGPLDDWLSRPDDLPDAQKAPMRRMQRNARRLLRLINHLLDLAKLEVGEWRINPETANLTAFARDTVRSFEDEARRRKIDLQFDAEDDVTASFDPSAMETILSNLIANALKFTPEGGRVRVSLQREGDAATLTVRDTGPGIPEEDLPHVFDRFHQSDDSSLRQHDGTGIGLALTRELLHRHGGSIDVESEVGFGTTFTLTIPPASSSTEADTATPTGAKQTASSTRPADTPAERSAPSPQPPTESRPDINGESDINGRPDAEAETSDRETLLIIDDDPDIRAYVRDGLSDRYAVIGAENGADGLDEAEDNPPDLIITDVMMPGMDGYDLCRSVKSSDVLDHVPVLILTARSEPERAAEGFEAGADGYLGKPFSLRDLRARIDSLLANRRRMRERFRASAPPSRDVDVPEPEDVASADRRFVNSARDAVLDHLDDEHFNVDAFAAEVGLSPRQLQRKLKSITDRTPSAFIRRIRLERGAQLIERDAGTISEIAYRVGFSSPSYFSRCFREEFGMPPSEFEASTVDAPDAEPQKDEH